MIHIDHQLIDSVSANAKLAPRQRINYNFHQTAVDTLHRMLNALEPGTYVCPHKHQFPDKREAFIILKGSLAVVEFDLEGNITDHVILNFENGQFGVEIQPATYHTIIALETSTVVYEIKDGPYDVSNDKGFAPWAPMEGTEGTGVYLEELLRKLNIQVKSSDERRNQ